MCNQLAHDLVRVPEGDPLAHQIVRAIGGVGKAAGCSLGHHILAEGNGTQHGGEHGKPFYQGIPGIKEGFFIFLHVLVISKGQALHHGKQGHEITVYPAGFATNQLGHVRILFLRHDRGTRGVGVVHLHKVEFTAAPQDKLLAEAA